MNRLRLSLIALCGASMLTSIAQGMVITPGSSVIGSYVPSLQFVPLKERAYKLARDLQDILSTTVKGEIRQKVKHKLLSDPSLLEDRDKKAAKEKEYEELSTKIETWADGLIELLEITQEKIKTTHGKACIEATAELCCIAGHIYKELTYNKLVSPAAYSLTDGGAAYAAHMNNHAELPTATDALVPLFAKILTALEALKKDITTETAQFGLTSLNRFARKIGAQAHKLWYKKNYAKLLVAGGIAGFASYFIYRNWSYADHPGGIKSYIGEISSQSFAKLITEEVLVTGMKFVVGTGAGAIIAGWQRARGDHVDQHLRDLPRMVVSHDADDIVMTSNMKAAVEKVYSLLVVPYNKMEQGLGSPFKNSIRTFLITGPSGSGKTQLFKKMNFEISKLTKGKILFIELTPNHYLLKKTEALADEMLALYEEKRQPIVFFFDEAHLGDSQETKFNWLKMADKINDSDAAIWVVGLTNQPEKLSMEVKRPGRFLEIKIGLPDYNDRILIIRTLLGNELAATTPADVDALVTTVALRTQGATPAALNDIVKTAKTYAHKEHRKVSAQDIDKAILEKFLKIVPGYATLSKKEKQLVAAHAAGLAVLACCTPKEQEAGYQRSIFTSAAAHTVKVGTPEHDEIAYGFVDIRTTMDHKESETADQLLQSVREALAPEAAQQILMSTCDITLSHTNNKKAYERCLAFVLKGFELDKLTKSEQDEMKHAARTLFEKLQKEVTQLFTQQRAFLYATWCTLWEHPDAPHIDHTTLMALHEKYPGIKVQPIIAPQAA